MRAFNLFKPNIQKLKAKGDIHKIIEAVKFEKEARIRRDAISALAEILRKMQGMPTTLGITETLIEVLLEDKDWQVQIEAAKALGEIGFKYKFHEISKALVTAFLESKDEKVQEAAKEIFVKIGEPIVEPIRIEEDLEKIIMSFYRMVSTYPHLEGDFGSNEGEHGYREHFTLVFDDGEQVGLKNKGSKYDYTAMGRMKWDAPTSIEQINQIIADRGKDPIVARYRVTDNWHKIPINNMLVLEVPFEFVRSIIQGNIGGETFEIPYKITGFAKIHDPRNRILQATNSV